DPAQQVRRRRARARVPRVEHRHEEAQVFGSLQDDVAHAHPLHEIRPAYTTIVRGVRRGPSSFSLTECQTFVYLTQCQQMARRPDLLRRTELAHAAFEVLRTRGMQTSMRELAEALGVKRPTPYFYFPDLGAVFE